MAPKASIGSAGSRSHAPPTPTPKRGRALPSPPAPPPLAKRAQVSAACLYCRAKKTKCDALRPCGTCSNRNVVCQYETERGETTAQAAKRKHEETVRQLETYEQLFRLIETQDERSAADIVRWIRSGSSAGAIVHHANSALAASNAQKFAVQTFLVNLAHSTGSLRQVVKLATSVSTLSVGGQIPDPLEFQVLCNRIVRFSYIQDMLQGSRRLSSAPPLLLNGIAGPRSDRAHDMIDLPNEFVDNGMGELGELEAPPHQVPTLPWTTFDVDDDAVSHLVSLFLNWVNPAWCYVEPGLFLKGMRSKQLSSPFCSPLLVTSVLAVASLHSEHDVAFSEPSRDRVLRGQHFHDEAMRLWALEEDRPTLCNIQAICILASESNYRAIDTLGLSLVTLAAKLDDQIPAHADTEYCETHGISQLDYTRGRLHVHWMVKCMHITMRFALLTNERPEPLQTGFPRIYDVFDDVVETWTGYPLTSSFTPYRPTLYLRERCRLVMIFQDLHALVLTKGDRRIATVQGFVEAVEESLEKMHHWKRRLPYELQYRWPMSVAVWELHASYLSFYMMFQTFTRTRLQQEEVSPTGQPPLTELDQEDSGLRDRTSHAYLSSLTSLAHQSAQMLREFRERYGLKITPAFLLQLQAVAPAVLIHDPTMTEPRDNTSTNDTQLGNAINSSPAAMDEVFRCLLGSGVETMNARAVARMTYHTVKKHKIVLGSSILSMLDLMSETAWRPSDVKLVKSVFPNFATTRGHDDHEERLTELLTKWETLEI